MTATVARFVGIPGAGKTTRAMGIIEKCRQQGYDLSHIGFSTFTRAARREAAERAARAFSCPIRELESTGWFRTLHSTVMRLLGVGKDQIVNGDGEWFKKNFNITVKSDDSEGWADQWKGFTPIALALKLWDVARNRLCAVRDVYLQTVRLSGNAGGRAGMPDLGRIRKIIEQYEEAKVRDDRIDFCDLILRYIGVRMTSDSVQEWKPEGQDSLLPIWFLDEAQDSSAALDRAFRRLTKNARAVYLMGDPNQEIYSWAGADGSKFMDWPVDAKYHEPMLKSWRCARAILEMGTRLICRNEHHCNLENLLLEPRCEGGTVSRENMRGRWFERIDPTRPTLCLARTNQGAGDLGDILTKNRIPWRQNRGNRRWPEQAVSLFLEAMIKLHQGKEISGNDWRRIVLGLPADRFEKGTKTRYRKEKYQDTDGEAAAEETAGDLEAEFSDESLGAPVSASGKISLADTAALGALPELVSEIGTGRWLLTLLDDKQRDTVDILDQWGEIARHPRVIASTIHGTKGMEAEDVFLDTAISFPVQNAILHRDGREQERRVWYTGITRAKENLVLLHDASDKHWQEVYAAANGGK